MIYSYFPRRLGGYLSLSLSHMTSCVRSHEGVRGDGGGRGREEEVEIKGEGERTRGRGGEERSEEMCVCLCVGGDFYILSIDANDPPPSYLLPVPHPPTPLPLLTSPRLVRAT